MFRLSRRTTLLLLTTVAVLQQWRYVRQAVVPAQDAVDVVYVAQRIEREGLAATVRAEPVPPLFPTLVVAAHATASRIGLIAEHDWASPPQWAAAAALVCAVIPVFLLTESLAGCGAAVVASLLFISIPSVARLGADGIGDALHLCLFASAVWFGVSSRPAVSGLCIAAALLVRAEAVVWPLATAILAVWRPECRLPRFFAAATLCLVPYLVCGVTTPAGIAERLRGGSAPTEAVPLNGPSPGLYDGGSWTDVARGESLTFGRKDAARSSRFRGVAATLDEFLDESIQAFAYVLPLLILPGIIVVRGAGMRSVDRLLRTTAGVHLALTAIAAYRGGYLSTRHFALPIVLTLPYAAVGLTAVCRRLAAMPWNRLQISNCGLRNFVTATFVVASLFVTARPLHESHKPHRRAADWLEANSASSAAVLDQQGYTALYTGRTTYRFDAAEDAFADSLLAYTLVERADIEADTPRGASLRTVLGEADRAVAQFDAARGRRGRDVLIFARR
jgi:hypothetical protein